METNNKTIPYIAEKSDRIKSFTSFKKALEIARKTASNKNLVWITKLKDKFLIINDIDKLNGTFIIACTRQNTEMDKAICEAQKLSEKKASGYYHVSLIDNEFKAVHDSFLNKNPKYKSLLLVR
jgi:CRISPR/Cas system Type II protein with McrA/HNH and RuvC-like nuclease domain